MAPADFGGVEGADAICQAAADDAGLEGTFLAWLSSADENEPAARFSQSGGPFVRTDGIIIADDWADLTDGQLIAPIDHDATGSAVVHPNGIDVITATAADGTRATGGIATCASYTQDVALAQPDRGNSNAIDSNWSAIGDTWDCGIAGAGLYCFEQ